MRPLEELAALGIPVTWGTLLAGWSGPGEYLRQLSLAEVIEYAWSRVRDRTPGSPDAEALLALSNAEEEQADGYLARLAEADGCDPAVEERKWRLLLLEKVLRRLEPDPLDGMIQLADFWARWGYPPDSPSEVLGGSGNTMPLGEYYSAGFLERAKQAHRAWIERERAALTQT